MHAGYRPFRDSQSAIYRNSFHVNGDQYFSSAYLLLTYLLNWQEIKMTTSQTKNSLLAFSTRILYVSSVRATCFAHHTHYSFINVVLYIWRAQFTGAIIMQFSSASRYCL
jgi:hypothetical protein